MPEEKADEKADKNWNGTAPTLPTDPASAQGRARVKPKLMCVEADLANAQSLERIIESDFQILTAASVSRAKELIIENLDLAVVLTDFQIREESGLDVLAYAELNIPNAVRTVLTADHQHLMGHERSREGEHPELIHRLILKPWTDKWYLQRQLREALYLHRTFQGLRDLEQLAMRDPVTHLPNTRFFHSQLKIEIDRANRHGRELSLIMIDLDHFKAVNDRLGHPGGDRLLRDVGIRLSTAVRNLDTVSRYGGDEFAVLLPDTSVERAWVVAERVRQLFIEAPFLTGENSTLVTLSLGIANCPTHSTTPSVLVEFADRALYRAKGQGRNQSVVGERVSP